MKNKSFDCVEMKRNAAVQIGARLSGCSIQDQLAYWNQKAAELLERLPLAAKQEQAGVREKPERYDAEK
jgi:Zn ribbon nucleic-acid-binding protein